ncbi:MAG TPA: hypothetical protein VF909_06820 [Roseiflexaceae bacterium]
MADILLQPGVGDALLVASGYIASASFHANVRDLDAAFIEKPFSPATLARKVHEMLDA